MYQSHSLISLTNLIHQCVIKKSQKNKTILQCLHFTCECHIWKHIPKCHDQHDLLTTVAMPKIGELPKFKKCCTWYIQSGVCDRSKAVASLGEIYRRNKAGVAM